VAGDSTFVYTPIAIGIVTEFQQAVLGIVSFAAIWANQIPSPVGAVAVVILRNRETSSATARN